MEKFKKKLSLWIAEHKCYAAAYTPQYMVYYAMIEMNSKINKENWEMSQAIFEKLKNIY